MNLRCGTEYKKDAPELDSEGYEFLTNIDKTDNYKCDDLLLKFKDAYIPDNITSSNDICYLNYDCKSVWCKAKPKKEIIK